MSLHARKILLHFLLLGSFLLLASGDSAAEKATTGEKSWLPLRTISQASSQNPSIDSFFGNSRQGRHFTKLDVCEDAICDQILRQAHGLSRIKMIRRYIRDTVATLDQLVTALDTQLVTVGINLEKSLGGACRGALAVLQDVTEDAWETEGFK